MPRPLTPTPLLAVLLLLVARIAPAADWPMEGADAQHSSSTDAKLPANLALHWSIDLPPLQPAWPDQNRLKDDAAYHPIVVGGRMIVASPLDDSVAAYDVADGRLAWRFFTQGPVRVTPAADDKGRLFVGSDDGYLYALESATGRLFWKFKAAPRTRPILGNARLIDTWAVRGGPVVADGKVYFAGGVWPFMGIFLHCLDAQTGKVVWSNSGDGAAFITQPHGDPSFSGTAPQGSLAINGDRLLVPNGRSVPAVYDRKTGKLLQFNLAYKFGGDRVTATRDYYLAGDVAFKMSDGKPAMFVPPAAAVYGQLAYAPTSEGIATFAIDRLCPDSEPKKLFGLPKVQTVTAPLAGGGSVLIRAADRLYIGGANFIAAAQLPLDPQSPDLLWKLPVDGNVVDLVAAADRLLAVTDRGRVFCFGSESAERTAPPASPKPARAADIAATNPTAAPPIADFPEHAGYCLAIGQSSEPTVREIIQKTSLHVILLEPDPVAAQRLRERFHRDELYGPRVAVVVGDIVTANLPPYFASIVLATDRTAFAGNPAAVAAIHRSLHPYHGVAYFPADQALQQELEAYVAQNHANNASVSTSAAFLKLTRFGGPPGAGNWTHEHADAANTHVSMDSLVKAPLGILWFGGTSNDGNLPRHGHGPMPQVCDGRLMLETIDAIRATDIYTGRLLWETPMPGVGSFFNNTTHQAGANGTGSNFVSTSDGIYIATEKACVVLDARTGVKRTEFPLPKALRLPSDSLWGYLNVEGDYLIGGAAARAKSAQAKEKTQDKPDPFEDPDHKPIKTVVANARTASSQILFVLDRHTGKLLWSVQAEKDFRHNAICSGGGRLFLVDLDSALSPIRRFGKAVVPPKGILRAFTLANGRELWRTDEDVFGTYLSYSAEHDILMESGRKGRDTLKDEPTGMRAYRAATGKALWYDDKAVGLAMIRGRTVMKESSAVDLITGATYLREDPITGKFAEWTWKRLYGCNTPVVSQNLITFRSGAAGYYDLARCGGTGNFGGFRSGCTNNLIVAGGVLSAPDYTRTCTCSYQMQTSLALVPDADAEMWTYTGASPKIETRVKRIGINFGAPGDRIDDNGTQWLEYPSVGGKSPVLKISINGDKLDYVRRHASAVEGPMAWVTASGVVNARNITLTLDAKNSDAIKTYTVRLYFAQPAGIAPSKFSVALQGTIVEPALDVTTAAGGADRSLVKEYRGIEVTDQLLIDLKPARKGEATLLGGIEVISQE
ncbi:MAG: outer rane biosis protein [Phycisphaerales bacterium]|nr:outer rane biosis protein [Phycisphaerales bacterium]